MASSTPTPSVGHPRGLSTLFFTEMWERFSFYGMKAVFQVFIGAAILEGGLGWSQEKRGAILAMYGAAVYLLGLPGGWIADNFLGLRRAVVVGGLIIMLGHILLAVPSELFLYAGLICLVIGTGFLKPNVSTLVGQLYEKEDPRRDAGFTFFYMGINIGAFLSPLACGWVAESQTFRGLLSDMGINPHWSWHISFGLAAVGMGFGIIQFVVGMRKLPHVGAAPVDTDAASRAAKLKKLYGIVGVVFGLPAALGLLHASGAVPLNEQSLNNIFGVGLLTILVATFVYMYRAAQDDGERVNVLMLAALGVGCALFWALFDQGATTMNDFAAHKTDKTLWSIDFATSYFQALNPLFIVLFGPLMAKFWVRVNRSSPWLRQDINKFALALVIVAAGFLLMQAGEAATAHGLVSPLYLVGFFFLATVAELFLSPVGLSSFSRLAPARAAGMVMGVWFMCTAAGSFLAGQALRFTGKYSPSTIGWISIGGAVVVAAVLFVLAVVFHSRSPDGQAPSARVIKD